MTRLLLLVAAAAALGLAFRCNSGRLVSSVVDGGTLALGAGEGGRLVQFDTPEVGSGECYSRAAAKVLRRLAPPGSDVRLDADPRLDEVDRYGRLLRYVHRGGVNVNVELVRRGAATVWFYGGTRGRYASALLAAARSARANRRGLWGACNARWDPYGPATTLPRRAPAPPTRGSGCDTSYPTVCIPPPPPDLDCADVGRREFRVVGRDPGSTPTATGSAASDPLGQIPCVASASDEPHEGQYSSPSGA